MIRRFGPWPVLALLLSLALPAAPALADRAEAGAQICERAIIARRPPRGACRRTCCTRSR